MFSVIIPLYNKAPYVEKAISSVFAQTCQEFELIVLDDGSTDDSLEVVKSLQLSTFNFLLLTQKNSGVSTARNNAVEVAKYDYIAFLDADDWWAPTFLEEMKVLIEEFPDAGIYGSSYSKVKHGRNIPGNIGVPKEFERGYLDYFQTYSNTLWMPLWTGAVIVPKTIFKAEKGFKPELKLGEDFDLWVRIVSKHKAVLLNKPLAYYNQDVELIHRAVGERLYEPEQHMLFTDYGALMQHNDFKFLFEQLSLYSLLSYYLNNKNKQEVSAILSAIDWEKHPFKYRLYYKLLPKWMVKLWFGFLQFGSKVKNIFKIYL